MISIQQIEYILRLSEERHFLRASELCFVTQPTLSMQIKKAEDMLGGKVFDRSRNPIELTTFGKEIVPVLRDVFNEYSRIQIVADKNKGHFIEEIRLAIIPTITSYLIPDLYENWRSELKDIRLVIEEMKTEDILLAMEQNKIDMGILAGPVVDSRLRTVPLYQEEIKAFIPSCKKKKISTTELMNEHPWLLTKGNCLRTQMMHFCELKMDDKDSWDYEGGNIDLLLEMVRKQGGYTLVPNYHIKSNSKDFKTIVSSSGEKPARDIIAISHNRSEKWKSMERIIRSVQLKYASKSDDNYSVLGWK